MSSEGDNSGLELARFFVNEFHAFFGHLKEKLDNLEGSINQGTVGNGTLKRGKIGSAAKRTGKVSAFNLFVRDEILRGKDSASTAPEGTREGAWLMSCAAKKWRGLSTDQKKQYAESKKEDLGTMNGAKAATDGSPPPAADATAEDTTATAVAAAHTGAQSQEVSASQLIADATLHEKKKKKKRVRDSEVGAPGESTAVLAGEGAEKKKKKKKKPTVET